VAEKKLAVLPYLYLIILGWVVSYVVKALADRCYVKNKNHIPVEEEAQLIS
jgi:SNF family Na+-dependent transporter